MAQRYFELTEDMTRPDRWLLRNPIDERGREVRTRQFMSGEPTRHDGHISLSTTPALLSSPVPLWVTRVGAGFFPPQREP
jgi:hypothetical protein